VVLIIVIMFRTPLMELLNRMGAIVDRASKEPFDIQLGEKLKLSFKEAIQNANPKSVEEAVEVAEREADKAISIFELLSNIPMKRHHKDLLLKLAKGGSEGVEWYYGGDPDKAPGKTMGFLLAHSLVTREGNRYSVHPLVREYIFKIHGKNQP
ncbi:MAG: hypothetical protein WBC98_12095, partial [Candidatus Zixiibacteriota bacterium]